MKWHCSLLSCTLYHNNLEEISKMLWKRMGVEEWLLLWRGKVYIIIEYDVFKIAVPENNVTKETDYVFDCDL